jgi:uncharacterized membrane protein
MRRMKMVNSARAKSLETRKLVLLALLTAIVVVLQVMASVLPVYPFTLTLVLVPIVIGASLIGTYAGVWLGLVFGFVVLVTPPQATLFLAWNAPITIVIVLLKGALAGLAAGVVYKALQKRNKTVAVIMAAIVCPIVNTGIFIIGCYLFFMPFIEELFGAGMATQGIFLTFVGINFPLELAVNLVLSPTIVRLIQIGQKKNSEFGIQN